MIKFSRLLSHIGLFLMFAAIEKDQAQMSEFSILLCNIGAFLLFAAIGIRLYLKLREWR